MNSISPQWNHAVEKAAAQLLVEVNNVTLRHQTENLKIAVTLGVFFQRQSQLLFCPASSIRLSAVFGIAGGRRFRSDYRVPDLQGHQAAHHS